MRAPAGDFGQAVVEQRREHFTVEIGRGDGTDTELGHCEPAPLPERSLETRLTVLRLVRVRPARLA